MGKAIPYDYRVKIVQRKQSGQSNTEISEAFGFSESGVKKIWNHYKKEGDKAFKTKYHNCGTTSPYGDEVRNPIKEIRDNAQGAPYVRSKFVQQYPYIQVPSERTLSRWWKKEQTNNPKGRPTAREKKVESKAPRGLAVGR